MRARGAVVALLTAIGLGSVGWAQDLSGDVVEVPADTVFEPVVPGGPKLDQRCVVSILNRTAKVGADGTFVLTNVPTSFGPVRARATCTENGKTETAQSGLLTVPPNGVIDTGPLVFDAPAKIPTALAVVASPPTLAAIGATAQLTVTATFDDGSSADVTSDPATAYRSSNPAVATVGAAGLVTAAAGGAVLVTVLHEGVNGFVRLTIDVATVDTDGDGIPDAVELANGLDPADARDGFADPDGDGLTNKQELVDFGTDPHTGDTDGDGLSDQSEVLTHHTNPLAADTDGDGLRDGLEIQTGTNPLDATSFDLAAALSAVEVAPKQFVLTVNTIVGEAALPLAVTGHLIDGTTLDLAAKATFTSSDATICTPSTPSGTIRAGANGICTITVALPATTFATDVHGRVQTFAPTPVANLALPSFGNNLDVVGDLAYVAAGSTGLQVVDVSDRTNPHIVGALDTPGNAFDVRVVGTTAYVADGASGLAIMDVGDPTHPKLLGAVDTTGTALDVVVKDTLAYVADGASGLQIVDVSDPAHPALRGVVDTPGTAKGVDVMADQPIAVVADANAGVRVVDVSDPDHPALRGSVAATNDARDVTIRGTAAFVADYFKSLMSVDITDPAHPVVTSALPIAQAGGLTDVALFGRLAFLADVRFLNAVPIVDVSAPSAPLFRAYLDFSGIRNDDGNGIKADARYVYLTAGPGTDGTSTATHLYIGQYLAPVDTAGVAPTVQITAPAPGATVIEADVLPIAVTAADDVAVTSVDFLVDGSVVRTATAQPYQHTITVPTGVASLTLGATAIDFGNALATADDVTVSVIPDPNTTVAGKTVDEAGAPLAGVSVTCLGLPGTSAADGTFAIPGVPTIRGAIGCTATVPDARGRALTGAVTGIAPVRGGTASAGNVVLALRVAFAPRVTYATGAWPNNVQVGDFNGDGKLDLVNTNSETSSTVLGLLLGNGDGTLRTRQYLTVGLVPVDVDVADFNGDGKLDVVAVAGGAGTVAVLLGNGDGTFQTAQPYAIADGPYGVAVGDVDGDHVVDIVTGNRGVASVSVLRGKGDGTFEAPKSYPVPSIAISVAIADLDGDGDGDVLEAASGAHALAVLLSNGDGTLAPYQTYPTGNGDYDVETADLDGDGKLDAVVTNIGSSDLSVLFGKGDGTFQPEVRYASPGNGPSSLRLVDVNGDGFVDVVHANSGTSDFTVRLNSGDGTLLPRQSFVFPGGNVRGLAVGDLNGDGKPDVLACGYGGGAVQVRLQQ